MSSTHCIYYSYMILLIKWNYITLSQCGAVTVDQGKDITLVWREMDLMLVLILWSYYKDNIIDWITAFDLTVD